MNKHKLDDQTNTRSKRPRTNQNVHEEANMELEINEENVKRPQEKFTTKFKGHDWGKYFKSIDNNNIYIYIYT